MRISVEDKQGLFKSLKVEVEGDVVRSALDEVYNYLRQNAEVEGFRKGKAPLWIIRAKFKEYIREEVGKRVANATLSSAIQESGLKPVADIYLENVELEEQGQKLSYSISFEVPPEFELQNVEGLEVEIKKVEFNEDLVKQRIEEIRQEHAVWEPVEREVKEGDLVVVDYKVQELESGETTEGETSGVIGTRTFREEIEKELIGKKEGDSFVLDDLTLYDVEGKPAGKARVEITVKSIKEKLLPELNDDFAKELGLGETWAEAEEKIREEVKASLENLRKAMISDAVAVKLVQLHQFEVPQTLLQRELSHLVERKVRELSQWGIDPKYLDYKAIAQELTPQAVFNIKLRYVLEKYAQQKNIEVSIEEIQQRIETLARAYERTVEEMREFLERENLLPVLEEDIKREKALEDIVSKAVVKETEDKKEEKNENT
ncbi:trigger factor [Hydrogenobacter sp. T-2]|uniref:trigger factor n=1 Tax=Pampinifervens diazotrophicum TaxID=1632018 RepID=UPI002B262999|nr:trigger factor [Hydrogenobacter sp. T-2]WPM32429.1 trigger factor [Hydrogenobacter sp. T-2]